MPLQPQRNRECPRCAPGNRSLKHIDTIHRQVTSTRPDPEFLLLAIYQCETCAGIDVAPFEADPRDRPE